MIWEEPFPIKDVPGYAALVLVTCLGIAYVIRSLRNGKAKRDNPTSGELDPAAWEQKIDQILEKRLSRRNLELAELFRKVQREQTDECAKEVRKAVEQALKQRGI